MPFAIGDDVEPYINAWSSPSRYGEMLGATTEYGATTAAGEQSMWNTASFISRALTNLSDPGVQARFLGEQYGDQIRRLSRVVVADQATRRTELVLAGTQRQLSDQEVLEYVTLGGTADGLLTQGNRLGDANVNGEAAIRNIQAIAQAQPAQGVFDRFDRWVGQFGDITDVGIDVLYDTGRLAYRGAAAYVSDTERMSWDEVKAEYGENIAELAESAFGAEGIIGMPIKMLPDRGASGGSIRGQGRSAFDGVVGIMDDAYRFANDGLATMVVASSLATADGGNVLEEFGGLFQRDTWREARGIVVDDNITLGRAVMLAFMTEDIRDPIEVGRAQGTALYESLSGAIDFTSAIVADPLYVAGNAYRASRAYRYVRPTSNTTARVVGGGPINTAVDDLVNHPRMVRFLEGARGRPVDELLRVYGDVFQGNSRQAGLLSEASSLDEAQDIVRAAWADPQAIGRIQDRLVARVYSDELLTAEQARLRAAAAQHTLDTHRRAGNAVNGQIRTEYADRLQDVVLRYDDAVANAEAAAGTFARGTAGLTQAIPEVRRVRSGVYRFAHSNRLAASPARPVVAISQRAMDRSMPNMIALDGDQTHMVKRLFNRTTIDDATRNRLLNDYLTAPGSVQRQSAIQAIVDEVVDHWVGRAGVTDVRARQLIRQKVEQQSRRLARTVEDITARTADGKSSVLPMRDSDLALETLNKSYVHVPDVRIARQVASWQGRLMSRYPSTWTRYEQFVDALQAYNSLFKLTAVVRPSWTTRVVPEEFARGRAMLQVMFREAGLSRAQRRAIRRGLKVRAGSKAAQSDEVVQLGDGAELVRPGTFSGTGGRRLGVATSAEGRLGSAYVDEMQDAFNGLLRRIDDNQWVLRDPTDPQWAAAWNRVANEIVGQSRAGSRVLRGLLDDVDPQLIADELVDWMETTAEGRVFRQQFPGMERRATRQAKAEALVGEVQRLFPTDEVMEAALRGDAVASMMDDIPVALRPHVDGAAIVEQTNKFGELLDDVIRGAVRWFGDLPSDQLVRHPFAGQVYRMERQRGLAILDAQLRDQYFPTAFVDNAGKPVKIRTAMLDGITPGQWGDEVYLNVPPNRIWNAADDTLDGAIDEMAEAQRALGNVYDVVEWFDPDGNARYAVMDEGVVTDSLTDLSADAPRLTAELINQVEENARQYAIAATRRNFYDLSEASELGESLRFIVPFFNAWEEVLVKWGRIAGRDPVVPVRLAQAWSAPERLGITTENEFGDTVISFTMPSWATPSWMEEFRDVEIPKDAFNTILTGLPGFGPLASVPIAEFTKNRPDLRDDLEFLFPFGIPEDSTDALVGSITRTPVFRLGDIVFGGDAMSDVQYGRLVLQTYQSVIMEWHEDNAIDGPYYEPSEAEKAEMWAEAEYRAKNIARLRTLVNITTPAPFNFRNGPIQDVMNDYREYQELWRAEQEATAGEPDWTPESLIYEQYGSSAIAILESAVETAIGFPATIEGWEASRRYDDVIEQFPDQSWVIVGLEGNGDFAPDVWAMADQEVRDRGDIDRDIYVELGWQELNGYTDLLNADAISRGGTNYKDFEDLSLARRMFIEGADGRSDLQEASLMTRYPTWYDAYRQSEQQGNREEAFIRDAEQWIYDDRFTQTGESGNPLRPDLEGLRAYIEVRGWYSEAATEMELSKVRGLQSSVGLEAQFDRAVSSILAEYPEFSSIYYRYLDRDPVEAR